jgi:Ca2+-binding EF-hand superfamily protein
LKIRTITTALALSLAATTLMADEKTAQPAKQRPAVDRSSKAASGEVLFARYDKNKDGKVTRDEFKGGKTLFDAYDADKDDVLVMDEIKEAKQAAAGPNFRELDTDKDGFVTRREWQGTQEEFDAVDLDHDGVWSKLDRALEKRHVQAKGEIQMFDTDKNGVISSDEWTTGGRDVGSFRVRDLNKNGSLDLEELATPPAKKQ